MNKLIYSFLLLSTVCTSRIHAQDFYLKAGAGYAFALPGAKMDQYSNVLNGSVANTSPGVSYYDLRTASFSSGVQGAIGGGLTLSKNMAVELDAAMNLAPHSYTGTISSLTNSSGVVYDYTAVRQGKGTAVIVPSFVLQTANSKWNIYMRMGLALPVNSGMNLHETFTYQNGDVHIYNWSIQNYFTLGFTGAAGLKLKISDDVSLWLEASLLDLNLSRKQRDLVSADLDGKVYPASMLSGGVKTYYYHQYGYNDPYGNQQALAQPFSNLGMNVGITYTVPRDKKTTKNTPK